MLMQWTIPRWEIGYECVRNPKRGILTALGSRHNGMICYKKIGYVIAPPHCSILWEGFHYHHGNFLSQYILRYTRTWIFLELYITVWYPSPPLAPLRVYNWCIFGGGAPPKFSISVLFSITCFGYWIFYLRPRSVKWGPKSKKEINMLKN